MEGLVAVSSEAASSQQCRGLQCMRLRGGFFGQKKKQEEVSAKPESFPVMNVVTASMATVLTMGLGSSDPEYFKEGVGFLGLQRWQLLIAGSYGAFFLANMVPGRLDTVLGRPKAADRSDFSARSTRCAVLTCV